MKKIEHIGNERLKGLIEFLNEKGRETKTPIWRSLAERLASPKKNRAEINVSRIERHTKENEIIAVPGKVLGTGKIRHPVTVVSLSISGKAKEKIETAGGRHMSFKELFEWNPKGSKVKIMR